MEHDWKTCAQVGTGARRARLRAELVRIASRRITEEGASSLRARDIAAEAGCAVGTLYNIFPNMTALVLSVNGRTLATLGVAVAAAAARAGKAGPAARLAMIAQAYVQFARRHPQLWRAQFETAAPGGGYPAGYCRAMEGLLSQIAAPLAQLHPHRAARQQRALARAMLFALQGMVDAETRSAGSRTAADQCDAMVRLAVRQFAGSGAGGITGGDGA